MGQHEEAPRVENLQGLAGLLQDRFVELFAMVEGATRRVQTVEEHLGGFESKTIHRLDTMNGALARHERQLVELEDWIEAEKLRQVKEAEYQRGVAHGRGQAIAFSWKTLSVVGSITSSLAAGTAFVVTLILQFLR